MKKKELTWQQVREIVIERLLECRTEEKFHRELYKILNALVKEEMNEP